MAEELLAYSRSHHPAPYRRNVALTTVLYGLFAAPIAWAGALIINFALIAGACYPDGRPLGHPRPGFGSAWTVALICHLIALAVIVSGLAAAYRCWRATSPHGHTHEMIESGRGRDRYLGMVGLGFDAMFLLITLAEALSLAMVPLCTF